MSKDKALTEQEHLFYKRYERLKKYEKSVKDSLEVLSTKCVCDDTERIDGIIDANLENAMLWLDNPAKNIVKDYVKVVEGATNLHNWEYATSTKEINKNILEARLKICDFIGKVLVHGNYVQQQKVLSSQSDY